MMSELQFSLEAKSDEDPPTWFAEVLTERREEALAIAKELGAFAEEDRSDHE